MPPFEPLVQRGSDTELLQFLGSLPDPPNHHQPSSYTLKHAIASYTFIPRQPLIHDVAVPKKVK